MLKIKIKLSLTYILYSPCNLQLISNLDALDYIYIANSVNDRAFLIAEPHPEQQSTDGQEPGEEEELEDMAVTEDGQLEDANNNNSERYYSSAKRRPDFVGSLALKPPPTEPSTTAAGSPLATAALAAAAASASVAAAAARITAKAAHRALTTRQEAAASSPALQLIDMDNNYTNVAVGLGAMLLNDTLLLEGNDSSLFGEMMLNRSGQLDLANGSAGLNVTTSKVAEDDFTQLLRMAVTSVLLGLMILVTIIGKYSLKAEKARGTLENPVFKLIHLNFLIYSATILKGMLGNLNS